MSLITGMYEDGKRRQRYVKKAEVRNYIRLVENYKKLRKLRKELEELSKVEDIDCGVR